jgi:3-deoxy-D-manno-octulosonic-acid transferase
MPARRTAHKRAAAGRASALAAAPRVPYFARVNPGDAIYGAALRLAAPVEALAAPFSDKLRRGAAGRRAALDAMRAWAATSRDRQRPLVWLHAPSVGEALMAQAILSAVKETEPAVQAAFTFFSPSAERAAARVGADWAGYLPWDTVANARAALDALRPSVVAFVRTEIWPSLVRVAAERDIATVLVNGVLARGSSRTGRGARLLLAPAYARLDAVGAVSDDDAAAFALLDVLPERIRVTGDARFDQVWQRVSALDADRPLLRPLREAAGPWLVAGSTWPADEARLVGALTAGASRGWRLLVAPHEPTAAHLAALERRLDAAGLSHARLHTEQEPRPVRTDVVVVDRVGVLADLYAAADAAYVGGGFGRDGLHSVVEPAALGVPVVYGPHHGNAREAGRLAAAGGGFVVDGAASLGRVLAALTVDDARRAAGAAARAFVRSRLGGAAASARLLLDATARRG